MATVPDWSASAAALAAAAGFGAVWGSFMNVCIARVPLGQSVVRPGSHCFACGAPVRAFDNIPVVSFLLLRGRCRSCGARFSARYLLVELLAATLSTLAFVEFVSSSPGLPLGLRMARYALVFAFAGVLLVLSAIDLDTKRLPDIITLPAIPVFFLAGFGARLVPWPDRLIGLVAGYLVVRLVGDAYYYITGREGLGMGDAKLLAVIGAVLGWKAIPVVIFSASFLGIAVAVPTMLLARRRAAAEPPPSTPAGAAAPGAAAAPPREESPATGATTGSGADAPPGVAAPGAPVPMRHAEVPFGPFLSASALIYLLAGERIRVWLAPLFLRE